MTGAPAEIVKAPTRPVLRWHGGKWKLAPWIIGHFPPHRIYVEPFGGAASVLLRKARSFSEIYNDLDDDVVNLFRVLRDRDKAALLRAALSLTPFARAEFDGAYAPTDDAIERARRLIVRSYMGYGSDSASGMGNTGFRAQSPESNRSPEKDWLNYASKLESIVSRLAGVVIERRPAIDIMRRHDGIDTLLYLDPPYLPETRSPANKYDLKHRMYRHELDVAGHERLLGFLRTLEGMVVLSGYPSALYDEALADWHRVEKGALADGARKRTEVLWINPACWDRLEATRRIPVQEPLIFGEGAHG